MKQYHAPELLFEELCLCDVLTKSGGGAATVGPTSATDPTDPTRATDPTAAPTEPTTASGGGIVLPEDTFG